MGKPSAHRELEVKQVLGTLSALEWHACHKCKKLFVCCKRKDEANQLICSCPFSGWTHQTQRLLMCWTCSEVDDSEDETDDLS